VLFPSCICCATNCSSFCDPAISTSTVFQAVIGGIADATCTPCTAFNNTYVLPYDTIAPFCLYRYSFAPNQIFPAGDPTCDPPNLQARQIYFQVILRGGTNYISQLVLDYRAVFLVTWEYDHGTSKPDCSAFSSLSLTLISQSGVCDASAATASISAV